MKKISKGLPTDYIAIDTNVFWSIAKNGDILMLLSFLMVNKARLLVDQEGKIQEEYGRLLNKKKFQKKHGGTEIGYVMGYWMAPEMRHRVDIAQNSELRDAVLNIMPSSGDEVDATFVCVAFIKDRVLITDDRKGIFSKPETLKQIAKRSGLTKADVISSNEACAKVPQSIK